MRWPSARAVIICIVTLAAATPTSSGAASGASALTITGYIEQGSAPSLIDRSARELTTVGVDGITLGPTGSDVTTPDGSELTLLGRAHADGLRGELLISNYDDAIGDFSAKIAAELLASPANIHGVALQIANLVSTQGWDGITVDLESLAASDQAGLVDFVTELRSDLPFGRTLSVDVGAATSVADYQSGGYDLSALGSVVDRVVLMAYDQHGPWSQPGPIGAINWQRQALRVLLTQVDPAKVDLGVAGYGYAWPRGRQFHNGPTVSDATARQLVQRDHVSARWVSATGEWTARLTNGTQLWWSDARSYRLRIDLARTFHLHGVAVWQLASCDPLTMATGSQN
jgi:spore germination protein